MAGKISELVSASPASALGATDQFEVTQGGVSKGATGAQLKTWALTGVSTAGLSGAYADLTGKPSLATVATSGNSADLADATTVGKALMVAANTAAARSAIGAVINTDVQAYNANLTAVVKNNFVASAAPGLTDDSGSGYAAGSRWMWATTGETWVCRDATSTAAKWVKAATADHPGYVANNWYYPFTTTVVAGSAMSSNTLKLYPWLVVERCTLAALGARVTTLHAGGNFQLGVYASNPTTKMPTGNVLASTSNLSTAATGEISGTASVQLEPGLYWIGFNTDDTTVVFQAPSGAAIHHGFLIGSATAANVFSGNTTSQIYLTVASTNLGTWPDLTAASFADNVLSQNTLLPRIKIASVP